MGNPLQSSATCSVLFVECICHICKVLPKVGNPLQSSVTCAVCSTSCPMLHICGV